MARGCKSDIIAAFCTGSLVPIYTWYTISKYTISIMNVILNKNGACSCQFFLPLLQPPRKIKINQESIFYLGVAISNERNLYPWWAPKEFTACLTLLKSLHIACTQIAFTSLWLQATHVLTDSQMHWESLLWWFTLEGYFTNSQGLLLVSLN